MLQSARRVIFCIKTARTTRCFSDSRSAGKGTWKPTLFALQAVGIVGLASICSVAYSYTLSDEVVFRQAIERSTILPREEKHSYIERPTLESTVDFIVKSNRPIKGPYLVVYGPKGSGKSEIIDHYAMGRKKSVVKLRVTRADSILDPLEQLSRNLLGKELAVPSPTRSLEALQAAVSEYTTIIFEVERCTDEESIPGVLSAVRRLSKYMSPYCRCIIVLPDVETVLELGRDQFRETFVYVGEMTHEEAKQLVERLLDSEEFEEFKEQADGKTFKFSDKDLQYVFDTIGTNPATLINLVGDVVKSKKTVEQFVESVLRSANKELAAFTHQPILKALKEHPEGVIPEYFQREKSAGADLSCPKDVSAAMRIASPIVYRIELDQYQLVSTAHKTALKSYDPIVPSTGKWLILQR